MESGDHLIATRLAQTLSFLAHRGYIDRPTMSWCFEHIIPDAPSKELDPSFLHSEVKLYMMINQIESSTDDDRVKSGSLLMTRNALWYLI